MTNKPKKTTQGVYTQFRASQNYDALRVFVRPANGKQVTIKPALNSTLRQINRYLKNNKIKKAVAVEDPHFKNLLASLNSELRAEFGLKSYLIQAKLDLKRKNFDFDTALDEFEKIKSDVSVGRAYRSLITHFWLPFFIKEKGCEKPSDFINFKKEAEKYVRTAKNKFGRPYSVQSYTTLCRPLNSFMRFCFEYNYIKGDEEFFTLKVGTTMHLRKLSRIKGGKKSELSPQFVRTKDTYTLDDMVEIKKKIDSAFKDDLDWKLRSYGIYIGIVTGLRRGNLCGLKAKHLKPDDKIPHIEIHDNVLSGWNFNMKGAVVVEESTKTTEGEDLKIPMLAPDIDTVIEVAQFLIEHIDPEDRILSCYPDTVGRWWKKICEQLKIKYLHPHAWRHSFATVASLNLDDWFGGNRRLLQKACLHSSFRTTEKYINDNADEYLKQFARIRSKKS